MLASTAQFKARYEITGDTDDEKIALLLQNVSDMLAAACGRTWSGRPCLEKARYVHAFGFDLPGQELLWLPARPIIEIHEVLEDVYGQWSEADELIEEDDFILDAEGGSLFRAGGEWFDGPKTVRVDYTAGYTGPDISEAALWLPDVWTLGDDYAKADRVLSAGEVFVCIADIADGADAPARDPDHWTKTDVLVPGGLTEACLQQAGYFFQRRSALGVSGASAGGGSVSGEGKDDLLAGVLRMIAPYRRL